jgi:2-keto-4-pentenoate hydratase/2-oxohepta-3-ene-1,7-dioic acid hydratase in catechol pathway
MKLLGYRDPDGVHYGLLDGERVHPIRGATTLVEAWHAAQAGMAGGTTTLALEALSLAAPTTPVRNVVCVGWNYDDHFAEGMAGRGTSGPAEIPDVPTFFTKATGAVIGPADRIELHRSVTDRLDWEVELALILGRGGRDIDERAALDHVLGFTVANDVSARDVQKAHGGQWFRGKSLDGTCPIGPWVVTPDELDDFDARPITCRVNGEIVQSATLGDLHFGIGRIIAELSRGLTLVPGDLILTGTPSGVGNARTPPVYLAAGDVVESEIGGIGTLRNEVGG